MTSTFLTPMIGEEPFPLVNRLGQGRQRKQFVSTPSQSSLVAGLWSWSVLWQTFRTSTLMSGLGTLHRSIEPYCGCNRRWKIGQLKCAQPSRGQSDPNETAIHGYCSNM